MTRWPYTTQEKGRIELVCLRESQAWAGDMPEGQQQVSDSEWVTAVQSLSHVRLLANPRTAARQAPLSSTASQSLLKFTSTGSVMPSKHPVLCRLLSLPSTFPCLRVWDPSDQGLGRWDKSRSFYGAPSRPPREVEAMAGPPGLDKPAASAQRGDEEEAWAFLLQGCRLHWGLRRQALD